MAALFLLLASIGGVVVGDLVLENPTADSITVLNHPITGYSEGLLLAMAAALGLVLGLLVVASARSTRTRRARRKQLRTAGRDLPLQVAELERENARLREELARRDRPVRRHDEVAGPADLGSTASVGSAAEGWVTVPSRRVERYSEPLYEEARRVARLRSDPELASSWPADEHARRS
jgi:hypothetical protein